MRTVLRVSSAAVMLLAAPSAFAQVPIEFTISGNQAQGAIVLPGALRGDLKVVFESVTGLTPTSLQASAMLVNPWDPLLLPRLPALTSVIGAFPVLVRVGPGTSRGLRFKGTYAIALHTYNLEFDTHAPRALLKADGGGPFADITTCEGSGSYRVTGSGGDFSEFLIVSDARPLDAVIVEKFAALDATLLQHAGSMPLLVFTALQARLALARARYDDGLYLDAIFELKTFASDVIAHSGSDIPDTWQANSASVPNVAGLLRSGADTLTFSLDRRARP